MISLHAAPAVGRLQVTHVQSLCSINNEAGQMVLGKPVIHGGRKHNRRGAIARDEFGMHRFCV